MHIFKINSHNFLHKNYIIRIIPASLSDNRFINFVGYEELIPEVQRALKETVMGYNAACYGNWTPGVWTACGMNVLNYRTLMQAHLDATEFVEGYAQLAQEINAFNHCPMEELWFFLCLAHFTDALGTKESSWITQTEAKHWNSDYFDQEEVEELLTSNGIEMEKFYQEGFDKGFISKQSSASDKNDIFINKPKLFGKFLNALKGLQASFLSYDQHQANLLNNQLHPLTIKGLRFSCFKSKILYQDGERTFLTHIGDLKSLNGLPSKEALNEEVKNRLLHNLNEVSSWDLNNIPSIGLTGQVCALYLNNLLSCNDVIHIEENKVSNHLERELMSKKYIEDYVSYIEGLGFLSFTQALLNDISNISNTSPEQDEKNYLEQIKSQHTAVEYIKAKAKKMRHKNSGKSLMQLQDSLCQTLFGVKNLKEFYSHVKRDILHVLKNNTQFIYSKEKPQDEGLFVYGKNHIGFHTMKQACQLNYHMAFLQEESLFEKLKALHQVVPIEQVNYPLNLMATSTEKKYVLVQSLEQINPELLSFLLNKGRSLNHYVVFSLQDSQDINTLLTQYRSNIHDLSFSRDTFELLFGQLDNYKIWTKKVVCSGSQQEFIV